MNLSSVSYLSKTVYYNHAIFEIEQYLFPGSHLSRYRTVIHQLLDIMYHTIESPLTLYLGFSAQGKSIEFFIGTNIGKDRFYRRHAVTIDHLAITTIDSPLHPVRRGSTIGVGDGDLPTMSFTRIR